MTTDARTCDDATPDYSHRVAEYTDRVDTVRNACSLEALRTYFVRGRGSSAIPVMVGCYELEQPQQGEGEDATTSSSSSCTQRRSGELRLYTVDVDADAPSTSLAHALATEGGVLDGKWFRPCAAAVSETDPSERRRVYAAACATGRVRLHALEVAVDGDDDNDVVVRTTPPLASSSPRDGDALCLSLDWDPAADVNVETGVGDARLVSSYSDGTLAVHRARFPSLRVEEEVDRWRAHSLFRGPHPAEVWTCCWGPFVSSSVDAVLSGGDDGTLKGWDLRCVRAPVFRVDEEHEEGVTAVAANPTRPHVFASGSYDGRVRIWDARSLREPVRVARSDHCGGGVWRIRWWEDDDDDGDSSSSSAAPDRILVGAMHGGCRVLEWKHDGDGNDDGSFEIITSFTLHESMAYGADWIRKDVAASCSFYDQRAFLWRAN